MSIVNEFDVLTAPLSGVHLVEANAGTGKTWNIEALVVRLLIDKRLEPSQVLVVTFTDAAAQELRERILKRINEVFEVLTASKYEGEDHFLNNLSTKYRLNPAVLEHLEYCKSTFDEASIYTIHSFCKQVLTDFRFESGLESELQIMPDSRMIQQEVIKDEWRSLNHRFSQDPESNLADILSGKVSLSQLENSFDTYSANSGLKLDLDPVSLLAHAKASVKSRWSAVDPSQWTYEYIDALKEAIHTWENQKDEIRQQWYDVQYNQWQYDYSRYGTVWEKTLELFLSTPFVKVNETHILKYTSQFHTQAVLHRDNSAPRPDHLFFELIDFLYHAKAVLENLILRESCERMKRSYLQKRQQQQILVFDDLLAFTERALDPTQHGENAKVLAEALRVKYPVALIDEFQDTDQTQYSIFRRLYVDHNQENLLLYMIGDPKQSIYLFRGADLKTYFKARKDAKSTYTLSRNFRSTQALVDGINAVFGGKNSFLDDELTYHLSSAKKQTSSLSVPHESDAPLRFVDIKARNDNKVPRELAVMKWVVSSIARLLVGEVNETTILDPSSGSPRPIHPGDIAILVSAHYQSRQIKRLLYEAGIPAVESGDASVFASEEAGYLNLLLDVILDPRRVRKMRALLTSPLLGLNNEQILAAERDEFEWSRFVDTFRIGEQFISQKGILAGLRYVYDRLDIEKNLVKRAGGERSLTNLRHLGELLHREEESQRRSLAGLASWLLVQRNDANAVKSDERSMRLESDDERVHIMTMHSSKGLQFTIVYAPFLWSQAWGKKSELFYALDPESAKYERIYDPDNHVQSEKGKYQSRIESLQDRIRLLYVTLTRAEQRCYVPFSSAKDFQTSPLYSVLASRLQKDGTSTHELGLSLVASKSSQMNIPEDWNHNTLVEHVLLELAKEHANCIHYERYTEYEKTIYYVKKSQEELISVREFQLVNEHRLFPGRLVSSYSSLQRKYGQDSTFDAVQRDEHTELPDDPLDKFEIAPGISNVSAEQKAIMNFPKGAHTGNFWHELLETVDFDDPSNWNQIVKETGMKYGITNISDVETLARLIRNTVESPIGKHPTFSSLNPHLSHLKLAGLRRSQTLREMEFLYPYSVSELHSLIDELFDGFPYSENISGLANIKKQDTVNLLTGLVDLVFESNGMYFILDYKSNHLGDSFKSYAHSEIELDIRINGYMIQYHLYTAALIKYLSKQIRDFSYERHFGGVFYLYWRGLNSIDTNGVFFDKPSWEMIAPFTGNLSVDPNISVEANIGGTIKSDIRLGAS